MPFLVGQRVTAAHTLGAFGDVRRGTPGTVVGVSYLGAYDVKFAGGRVVRGLRRDQLTARPPSLGLVGSGCLTWLAAAVLLAVAVMLAAAGWLRGHIR
jgi:hypothetical protein